MFGPSPCEDDKVPGLGERSRIPCCVSVLALGISSISLSGSATRETGSKHRSPGMSLTDGSGISCWWQQIGTVIEAPRHTPDACGPARPARGSLVAWMGVVTLGYSPRPAPGVLCDPEQVKRFSERPTNLCNMPRGEHV